MVANSKPNRNESGVDRSKVQYLNGPPANSYLSSIYGCQEHNSQDIMSSMMMRQSSMQYNGISVPHVPAGKVVYTLQLLSVKEFTVLAHMTNGYGQHYQVPVTGLRIHIKKLSKGHGKASYEKFKLDENSVNNSEIPHGIDGRWRIPLGCYQAFFGFLVSQENSVIGIPENQLKAATLGAQLADKSYPSAEALIEAGVPEGLSRAMAPYQRGGVDFVMNKNGRALIADEMGLGKTVQAIASMAVYREDWPLLVLTPSSARYHWETEFMQWLGISSDINRSMKRSWMKGSDDDEKCFFEPNRGSLGGLHDSSESEKEEELYEDFFDPSTVGKTGFGTSRSKRVRERHNKIETSSKRHQLDDNSKPDVNGLLSSNEVHVMSSGRDKWTSRSRVVIVSYGLIPTLVTNGVINEETFKCVICDESHMLKNMKTKRTAALIPVLKASKRCLMLSGTPAFARPQELFPQLTIIGANNSANGGEWWQNYEEFLTKYCKSKSESNIGGKNMGELHTLLESTVMIRRLKANILKELPRKVREKAYIHITDDTLRNNLAQLMIRLREGKGVLGKIAKEHWENGGQDQYHQNNSLTNLTQRQSLENEGEGERKQVLSELFSLTGMAKVPIVVAKLKEWLANPLNGKICIFAHHKRVLDAIETKALQRTKYIRIDGSTLPRSRQDRILAFQRDPRIKVALLGVTAAGVAVTLTASSTVWFAEMFWTPAILIQAEDRVHRIGQQSEVKCLYLIARGTLDEILWKLVEKKFRALGEFVEGKGKALAVHRDGRIISNDGDNDGNLKEYRSGDSDGVEELSDSDEDGIGDRKKKEKVKGVPTKVKKKKSRRTIMASDDDSEESLKNSSIIVTKAMFDDDCVDEADVSMSKDINDLFDNDPDFISEMAELAKNERISMGPKDDDTDSDDVQNRLQEECENEGALESEILVLSDDDDSQTVGTEGGNATYGSNNFHQNSIENPISIPSDDDDDKKPFVANSEDEAKLTSSVVEPIRAGLLSRNPTLNDVKFYKMQFSGPSYGIVICEVNGKILVRAKSAERIKEFGPRCKPHVGDIIVSINNVALPPRFDLQSCIMLMQDMMNHSPNCVEIIFVETKQPYQIMPAQAPQTVETLGSTISTREDENGVICIDDDE